MARKGLPPFQQGRTLKRCLRLYMLNSLPLDSFGALSIFI